jgi:hypothetical protein
VREEAGKCERGMEGGNGGGMEGKLVGETK